jgi:hypothetical protein
MLRPCQALASMAAAARIERQARLDEAAAVLQPDLAAHAHHRAGVAVAIAHLHVGAAAHHAIGETLPAGAERGDAVGPREIIQQQFFGHGRVPGDEPRD